VSPDLLRALARRLEHARPLAERVTAATLATAAVVLVLA
jgi:hypothetical protein